MKALTLFATVLLSTLFTSPLWAEIISFDTVTKVNIDRDYLSNSGRAVIISGLEKDTGNSRMLILNAADLYNTEFYPAIQRCLPTFFMAIDKPGRYFLHINVNDLSGATDNSLRTFLSCEIEVKV